MTISQLKQQIMNKTLDNFYLFAGEEGYVLKTYVNKISEVLGGRIEYVDTVQEVWSKIGSSSILHDPVVYVVMDDPNFIRADYENAWKSVSGRVKEDILILYYTKVDKRVKFWKFFQDRAVFFEHLNPKLLTRYIQKRANISQKYCDMIIEACESDLGRILMEIDKLIASDGYKKSKDSKDKLVERYINEGVIYKPPKDAIFDFVSAVLERDDADKIYDLLDQSYAVGESNMVIISVLYNNFANLLQVQTCNSDSIGKSTGLNGFQIKLVKPYVDNYTDDEILNAMKMLHRCELGIKTGEIRDEFTIKYVLANIL